MLKLASISASVAIATTMASGTRQAGPVTMVAKRRPAGSATSTDHIWTDAGRGVERAPPNGPLRADRRAPIKYCHGRDSSP